MAKKTWVKPMTLVQKFEANETVAACWGVACNTGAANDYEIKNGFDEVYMWIPAANYKVEHTMDGCGNMSNQYIIDDNPFDSVPPEMIEISNGEHLPCTFTDENYNAITLTSVKDGQDIFWTTKRTVGSVGVVATWHHQGVAIIDPRHPNRS